MDSLELQNLILEAPLGIAVLEGPEHTFKIANKSYMQLLFGREREILNKPIHQALPELEGQGIYELLDHTYKTGEEFKGQEILVAVTQSDGQVKKLYVDFSYQAKRNSHGLIDGIFVVVSDVTEQVQTRKQFEDDANLLRLITDRLPAFVSYMDRDETYRFVNRTFANWLGKPTSEIEGKTRSEMLGGQLDYGQMRAFEKTALSGKPVSFELTLKKPNGDYVNLDTEFLPDIDPKTGEVRGFIGVGQDVTERTRSLQAIEASENRFRSLTDTIPQLMWTSTAAGQVNYANERCLQYTGLESAKKYGDGWIETIHSDDLPSVEKAWQNSMANGIPFREEYRIRRFDGAYRWFLGSAIPIKDTQNQIQYWIGTATDIEEEKRIAQELQLAKDAAEKANSTKSAFLANMSHEIRTPLGAILGFSHLLKDAKLSPEERNRYAETINRNGQSLTHIIDDILDLAKVEAGRLEIEEINFSFKDLLFEVTELFKEKVLQKGIYLKTNFESGMQNIISSDPTRLRQILINIIGNAVKFTDNGGVEINVTTTQNQNSLKDLQNLIFRVEVKDTGCGLTLEQHEKLFVPFSQADNTTTRRYGGTGLGLALSKRLSAALGGDIRITESAPNVGCTFVVNFKARIPAIATKPVNLDTKAPSISDQLNNMQILLVDDSLDNQFLIKHMLVKYGAVVEVAGNGNEAVTKALAKNYDLVLMDIQMPEMDGYQATEILLNKGLKTPIVALTAHAMIEDRNKTFKAGFAGHLTKPINKSELLQTLVTYSRRN